MRIGLPRLPGMRINFICMPEEYFFNDQFYCYLIMSMLGKLVKIILYSLALMTCMFVRSILIWWLNQLTRNN